MSSSDPVLYIEKSGTVRGEQAYTVTKLTPAKGTHSTEEVLIKCRELGKAALGNYKAEEGGCSETRFVNGPNEIRCSSCGMDFSKYILKQEPYIAVKGLP